MIAISMLQQLVFLLISIKFKIFSFLEIYYLLQNDEKEKFESFHFIYY